ncbi:unnamed protein product [Caenorhabditis auriculariae]|uniref:Nudix hydrolase domain-containing protein n=1 Tax=Caenorhabditis auriculariae TaxID=2777116 RepID=A0A8S1H777_9PELO|nr:unnamed protein product [Caenorhabditis auriculariae]
MTRDSLRRLLRLSQHPTAVEEPNNAAVLILLDGNSEDVRVFLCVRSKNLRRHPGEVCFPGGMMDPEDEDVRWTAMREAEEEVGILPTDYEVLGNMPMFRARFGILIHPTVAFLRNSWELRLNPDEVEFVFWLPLSRFLNDDVHSSMQVDSHYLVHIFNFPEATTYGITALLCILVSMGALQRKPDFDLLVDLSVADLPSNSVAAIIVHAYSRIKMFL